MKRKIKCYTAYTTFLYRLMGVVLIPCAFWLLCMYLLWSEYGGFMGIGQSFEAEIYPNPFCFLVSAYVITYEIFTDHWVLGGCFSDAGKGLRYFRTSRSGVEVMRNIALVDLFRRFLYCMIFSAIVFVTTGWKPAIVMGLAMYCLIVGVLNGSRNIDGLQRGAGLAFLAQIGMSIINAANVVLIDLAGDGEAIMLVFLAVLYCVAALCVSGLMIRRITVRVQGLKD